MPRVHARPVPKLCLSPTKIAAATDIPIARVQQAISDGNEERAATEARARGPGQTLTPALKPGDQLMHDPQTNKNWIKHADGTYSPG